MLLTLPNKKDPNSIKNDNFTLLQAAFNLLGNLLIMIILMIFRRSQRMINIIVDEKNTTPADYSIMVTNIPIKENYNYRAELKKIFEYQGIPNEKCEVTAINLGFYQKEQVKFEKEINSLIQKKQKILKANNFDLIDPKIDELKNEILKKRDLLSEVSENQRETYKNFCGVAFISFMTEERLLNTKTLI